jgi:hypothetical protein
MSHPYDHAVHSTRLFGGQPEDYLPVHDWLDASKSSYAHFRHRAARHHAFGVDECTRIFGSFLQNSCHASVPVSHIAMQHIREDCGGLLPDLSMWFEGMPAYDWLPPANQLKTTDACAEATAHRFGGQPEDYIAIHEWFDEAADGNDEDRFRLLAHRHCAEEIFGAERLFGHGLYNSDDRWVPVRYVAELHIKSRLRFPLIPNRADWLRGVPVQRWMAHEYYLRDSYDIASHGKARAG